MPLVDVDSADARASGTQYILFFASGTPPWCPDCRDALPVIESIFGSADAPKLQVIKVGLRDEWKTSNNKWRGEPFHVKETPSIIKLIDSREVGRLGDQACKSAPQIEKLITAT